MSAPNEKLPRHALSILRTVVILVSCCVATLLIFHEFVMGGTSSLVYILLILLYALAAAVILLYQSMREQTVRDRMDRELARRNLLMNTALWGSDTRLFEVLPDGMLQLLNPRPGLGDELKTTLLTPARLLADLHCPAQWEPALLSAMEQAAAGQGSDVEVQTMDARDTWIQISLEPAPEGDASTAIGTIRDVTQQVQERHRLETQEKLLDRMMGDTMAAIEVGLEDHDWRILWGEDKYAHLLTGMKTKDDFPGIRPFVQERVLATIHPADRERFARFLDPHILMTAFRAGNNRFSLDYRVLAGKAPGYVWHSTELYLFRDPVTRRAKCNVFIRLATREKVGELEEKRRLEEREKQLFLRARKLVESEDELDFVQVISDYYQGIYVVDLDRDSTRSIKVPPYFQELLDREGDRLSATLFRYCVEFMDPQYVPASGPESAVKTCIP